MSTFTCICDKVTPAREPVCPLPPSQEDFLCDHCRADHPVSGQSEYDAMVRALDARTASLESAR